MDWITKTLNQIGLIKTDAYYQDTDNKLPNVPNLVVGVAPLVEDSDGLMKKPSAATNPVSSPVADAATLAKLAEILAKLSSDPATQTTLAAVLTALQGTLTVGGSVALSGSLSKVVVQDCTVANTEYTIDVNTALGHNSRGGFIKSATTNTGVMSIAFSQDGLTFDTFIPDIQPGEAISLDGIDLDSIKVKSTVAGDKVIVEVH
jgi:hypothetical protein